MWHELSDNIIIYILTAPNKNKKITSNAGPLSDSRQSSIMKVWKRNFLRSLLMHDIEHFVVNLQIQNVIKLLSENSRFYFNIIRFLTSYASLNAISA